MARVKLEGVWLHDPADPLGTSWHFRFNGDGAKETLTQEQVPTRVAGRARPVVDFGDAISETVTTVISCEREGRDLHQLRTFARRHSVLCYRDTLGRKLYGTLALSSVVDAFWGSQCELTVTSVDHYGNDLPVLYVAPPVVVPSA